MELLLICGAKNKGPEWVVDAAVDESSIIPGRTASWGSLRFSMSRAVRVLDSLKVETSSSSQLVNQRQCDIHSRADQNGRDTPVSVLDARGQDSS